MASPASSSTAARAKTALQAKKQRSRSSMAGPFQEGQFVRAVAPGVGETEFGRGALSGEAPPPRDRPVGGQLGHAFLADQERVTVGEALTAAAEWGKQGMV